MRRFDNIARLIKRKRINKVVSQIGLSAAIGYKNGQFISNIERGLCGLPAEKVFLLSELLDCTRQDIIDAITQDFKEYIEYEYEAKRLTTTDDEIRRAQEVMRFTQNEINQYNRQKRAESNHEEAGVRREIGTGSAGYAFSLGL